jgi:hypothetical protein
MPLPGETDEQARVTLHQTQRLDQETTLCVVQSWMVAIERFRLRPPQFLHRPCQTFAAKGPKSSNAIDDGQHTPRDAACRQI